jgi:hypothetical protein
MSMLYNFPPKQAKIFSFPRASNQRIDVNNTKNTNKMKLVVGNNTFQ